MSVVEYCTCPCHQYRDSSVCHNCHGCFYSSQFAYPPPLMPPSLSEHAGTVAGIYNNIFPPMTMIPEPRPHYPAPGFYGHPIRPGMVPELMPHHHIPRLYEQPPDEALQYHHIDHDRHHHHHDDYLLEAIVRSSIQDDEHPRWRRASESAIRGLPTVRVSTEHLSKQDECPVCKEKLKVDSIEKMMPCNHIFHQDCIVTWLEQNNTCPVCRAALPTAEGESSSSARRRRGNGGRNPLSCLFPRVRH